MPVHGKVLNEMRHHKNGPTCLIGDFNCAPEDAPALHDIIANHDWTDLGRVASIWGGTDAQPTCTAPNASTSHFKLSTIIK